MPKFSEKSLAMLETCHIDLVRLFMKVIETYDCSILCGHRNEALQEYAYNHGNSRVNWPDSKHNSTPSLAVDVAPWPIDWEDELRFGHFAGYVQAVAEKMEIDLRWGGDFDGDGSTTDQSFMDLCHFELVNV